MKEKSLSRAQNMIGSKLLLIILAAVALAGLFAPYGQYTYNFEKYRLTGWNILTGTWINDGNDYLSSNWMMILFVVAVIVVIVSVLLSFKIKPVLCSEILTVSAIVGAVVSFRALTAMSKIVQGGKNPTSSWGAAIGFACCCVLVIIGVIQLNGHKIMTALDFMIIPGMAYFAINNYVPMFGIYIAFKKVDYSKGLMASDWVGFSNFKYLFSTSDAWIITRNTLLYNAAFIVLGIITGVIVGICLAEMLRKFFQRLYQTLILLPQLISMVIVSYIVFGFLSSESGLITKMLDTNINFYAYPRIWPFVLIIVYLWKQVGYNSIIFLASIVGIDASLYEAARVDGAGKWQQIRHITLPQLRSTIITLFLLQVGRIFYSDFGLFYQVPLNSGALYNVTNTVDTYVYRALLVNSNISTASAASTYQAILGFVIVFTVNMIVRKVDRENALF